MDRDKMKEEIAKMLDEIKDEYCLSDHESRLVYSDRILSLPALREMLEKAEKWDRIEEIAKRNWTIDPCEDCPVAERCDSSNSLCGQADDIVEALSEVSDAEKG